jgi:hypothetical protein
LNEARACGRSSGARPAPIRISEKNLPVNR